MSGRMMNFSRTVISEATRDELHKVFTRIIRYNPKPYPANQSRINNYRYINQAIIQ